MTTRSDVLQEVLKDHNEIKQLLADVELATDDQKRETFEQLVRKLAVHETAEQEVVHPLARKAEASDIVEERLTEEKEATRTLTDLSRMELDSPSFQPMFEQLKADVIRHASMEETEEHPKIRTAVNADQLEKLGAVYRAAEAAAPTRPHPHAPTSATGNLTVGPVVAIVDRARDAVRDALQKLSA